MPQQEAIKEGRDVGVLARWQLVVRGTVGDLGETYGVGCAKGLVDHPCGASVTVGADGAEVVDTRVLDNEERTGGNYGSQYMVVMGQLVKGVNILGEFGCELLITVNNLRRILHLSPVFLYLPKNIPASYRA